MLAELQEAAQQGAKAKVHRLCVKLARNGRGVKGRRYTHVAASSPSVEEARKWLVSPAVEGGMSAKILPDFDSEVRKVLACFDRHALADLNKEADARKDLRDTLRTQKEGAREKVVPRVERASGVVYHGVGPTEFGSEGLDSTWTWLSQERMCLADRSQGHNVKIFGAGEACGRRKRSHAISCTSVLRSDTRQGEWEEWSEGIETDTHVLHVVESFFQRSSASQSSGPTFSLE